MSFSDAIGQIDQIVQWEQQLDGSSSATQTAAGDATSTDASTASGASSFADQLAAAQASTESSAAGTLTAATDTTDDSGSSSLLGGGDSQLLNALSSLSSSTATGSSAVGSSSDGSSTLSGLTALEDSEISGSSGLTAGTSSNDEALLEALQSAGTQQTTATSDSGAAGGTATSSSDPRIQSMTQEADSLIGKPYVWGGGHAGWGPSSGYDCSGFVSAVLHAGGYLSSPQDTTTLPSAAGIEQGPGQYVTIYDRDQPGQEGHVIMEINGQFYESGGEHGSWGGGGGVEQISTPSAAYLSTFNVVLHPAGL